MAEDGQDEKPSAPAPQSDASTTSPPSQDSEIEVVVPLLNVSVEEKGLGNVVTQSDSSEAGLVQPKQEGDAEQGT